jgi:ParB-like chromosome segregation protein Spo0J
MRYRDQAEFIASQLLCMEIPDRIKALNEVRKIIATASPFNQEPVDCVQWVPAESVRANDYNPNSVAPPEMELLRVSIMQDGYTQPIVAWQNDGFEVVDGFHRHRVGKEMQDVNQRIHNHLPLAVINSDRESLNDRMAATIRHNRARGKHRVESMSDIVIELKKRNWSDERISKELGMDSDEVLRLCQVAGLIEVFGDEEFSEAWEAGIFDAEEFNEITEEDL